VAALGVAGGPETDGTGGTVNHVVCMSFTSLHIGAEGGLCMAHVDFAAGEDVSRRMYVGNAISSGECVEPENSVFDQVNEDKSGYSFEGKTCVDASGRILDDTYVTFDVGYVFPGGTCVQHWEPWANCLKFIVCQHRCNVMMIQIEY